MAVPINPFKAALRAGQRQIGLWVTLANPYTTEICAGAGFDWLLLDAEHAPNDVRTILAQLQAAAAYPTHIVARPPIGATHLIKQYLDIGVTTLLVPMVETAEQARELVKAVRYPPGGIRGVGSAVARASRWNRMPGYLAEADDQICLLVQIESRAGLANLDSIAAVDGISGIFVGPSDLSADLGHRGDTGHPVVQEAIEHAFGKIRLAGKAAGILSTDAKQIARYLDLGASFVAVGIDVFMLVKATTELAEAYKGRPWIPPRGEVPG